jgi:hypothetical protein
MWKREGGGVMISFDVAPFLSLSEDEGWLVFPVGVVGDSRVLFPDLEAFKVSGSVRDDSGSARGNL